MEERKEAPEGVVACDLGESRNLAFNQQLGDLRIVTTSRATLRTVSRSSMTTAYWAFVQIRLLTAYSPKVQ